MLDSVARGSDYWVNRIFVHPSRIDITAESFFSSEENDEEENDDDEGGGGHD